VTVLAAYGCFPVLYVKMNNVQCGCEQHLILQTETRHAGADKQPCYASQQGPHDAALIYLSPC